MDTTTRTEIRIVETDTPSRSKGTGCAWIRHDGENTFATGAGRTLTVEVGAALTVAAKCTLRRKSGRADVERDTATVVVTGDPADTVTVTAGSPQAYTAVVYGVRVAR
ncbi:MAG: hypothetical protein DCC47_16055 [Acidobacteria bacterium]|nr:MAG: hypothetical protein DCC47_16055 [Acidobacteriota bacterium]